MKKKRGREKNEAKSATVNLSVEVYENITFLCDA